MSRTRITWNSVAAPSFADALRGVSQAGQDFSDAFTGFGDIAETYRGLQKDFASQQAIQQALGITDPNELNAAISSGSLFNPMDMNEEAMKFFQGRRTQLLADQSTMASTEGQRLRNIDQAFQNMRNPIEAAQDDWTFNFGKEGSIYNRDRSRKQDALTDANTEMNARAIATAGELAKNSLTRQEAKDRAVQLPLSPLEQQAVLSNLDQMDETIWSLSESTRNQVAATPTFDTLLSGLDSRRAAQNVAFGSDTNTRVYTTSIQRFEGSQNPIMDVLKNVYGDSANSAEFANTRGEWVKTFNDLTKKYSGLPPEVIAGIMEETVRPEYSANPLTGFTSGNVVFDRSEVENILETMNTPAERARLESIRQAYEREDKAVSRLEDQAQKLLDRATKALRDGKPEKAREYEAEALELARQANSYFQQTPMDEYTTSRILNRQQVVQADRNTAQIQADPNYSVATPMVPNAAGTAEEMLNNATNGGVGIGYEAWKNMTRAERRAAGLPESVLGWQTQNWFK